MCANGALLGVDVRDRAARDVGDGERRGWGDRRIGPDRGDSPLRSRHSGGSLLDRVRPASARTVEQLDGFHVLLRPPRAAAARAVTCWASSGTADRGPRCRGRRRGAEAVLLQRLQGALRAVHVPEDRWEGGPSISPYALLGRGRSPGRGPRPRRETASVGRIMVAGTGPGFIGGSAAGRAAWLSGSRGPVRNGERGRQLGQASRKSSQRACTQARLVRCARIRVSGNFPRSEPFSFLPERG